MARADEVLRSSCRLALCGAFAAGCSAPDGEPAEQAEPMGPDAGTGGMATGWSDVAPPAPPPDEGFQLHFGPTDLDDPAAVAPFILLPGAENVACGYARAPNAADAFYAGYELVLREGVHHLLVSGALPAAPQGSAFDCTFEDPAELFVSVQGGLAPGATRVVHPAPGPVAPENVGLAHRMPAGQGLTLQGHYLNATDAPLLREVWLSFLFEPPDQVRTVASPLTFYTGTRMSIPPHTRQTVSGTCAAPPDATQVRVLDLFGHVHAHGERVSAWHVSPGEAGQAPVKTLVYETYQWEELERYTFDSMRTNPPVTYRGERGGAASGILTFGGGDWLELECEFDNTLDQSLTFGARAFDAEMCAVIGSYAPSTGKHWRCIVD